MNRSTFSIDTPSAREYLSSLEFAKKRVEELQEYIQKLPYPRPGGEERFWEIHASATGLLQWWTDHLKLLTT